MNYKKIMIIVGAVLVLLSLLLYFILGPQAIWTRISLIVTLLEGIGVLVLNWKAFFGLFRKSGTLTSFYKVVQFLVILGILVILYLLSDTLSWKMDFTQGHLYSLSDETRTVLSQVSNDMKILYFKPTGMKGIPVNYQESLLNAYADKNPKIKMEEVDPYQNRVMAVDYNVKEDAMVVFEYKGNRMYVSLQKVIQQDPRTGKISYQGEEVYTTAIKSLLASKPKVVYVLKGHGEPNPMAKGNHGFSGIFERLVKDNIKLNSLDLLKVVEIPKDAGMIIVMNPLNEFAPDELDRLENYLNNGGNLLVMLEYSTEYMVNDLLRQMGVFFIPNLILEDNDNPQLGPEMIIPQILGHEITLPLKKNNFGILLRTAVGLVQLKPKDRPKGYNYFVYPLLKTSKYAYGEVSRQQIEKGKPKKDKKDMKGPLYPAFAIKRVQVVQGNTNQGIESRMVVFGDTDFVNNIYHRNYGNTDLFMNAVNYLLKRDSKITIRPKISDVAQVQLSSISRRILTFFAFGLWLLVLIPGLIIVHRRQSIVRQKEIKK